MKLRLIFYSMTDNSGCDIVKAQHRTQETEEGIAMNPMPLNAKYVIFLAVEVFVIATVAATMIAVPYQAIRAAVQREPAICAEADALVT